MERAWPAAVAGATRRAGTFPGGPRQAANRHLPSAHRRRASLRPRGRSSANADTDLPPDQSDRPDGAVLQRANPRARTDDAVHAHLLQRSLVLWSGECRFGHGSVAQWHAPDRPDADRHVGLGPEPERQRHGYSHREFQRHTDRVGRRSSATGQDVRVHARRALLTRRTTSPKA